MDIREKYYLMTGDFDGAYGMMETDQEAFKFSENTLQRALDMYQGMDSGNEKMFFPNKHPQMPNWNYFEKSDGDVTLWEYTRRILTLEGTPRPTASHSSARTSHARA